MYLDDSSCPFSGFAVEDLSFLQETGLIADDSHNCANPFRSILQEIVSLISSESFLSFHLLPNLLPTSERIHFRTNRDDHPFLAPYVLFWLRIVESVLNKKMEAAIFPVAMCSLFPILVETSQVGKVIERLLFLDIINIPLLNEP